MNFRVLAAALTLALASPTLAFADAKPTDAEAPFVDSATHDLNKMFPTPDAAIKAGYVRYTNEDKTGAISYANRQWTSTDADHPSQLWYDVAGHLLGADYSVLQADYPNPPERFGLAPDRWFRESAHVHYVIVGADGMPMYGGIGRKKLTRPGAVDAPTAHDLVDAGVVKSTSDVKIIFAYPAIWDVTVWVDKNPSGAFAEANPNVKPTTATGSMDMGH
jgi:hypothetical protein